MNNQRIIVDNLSWSTPLDEVVALFKTVGAVSSARLVTNDSGESLGVAIVTMTESDAAKAIAKLDGAVINSKKVVLKAEQPDTQVVNRMILAAA